jgi:hypothetical protein
MLPRQLKEIQFGSGLNTKGDRRAQPEQLLDEAINVEFDDVGGLRCRFPFDNVRTALVGGGTLSNARRLAQLDGELLCFTDTALYAWVPIESAWQYRGDHLAVMTDEQTVFAQPGDQFCCDRAELDGQIVYTWADGGAIMVAVADAATGAVIQPPTVAVPASFIQSQPRLLAFSNYLMLTYLGSFLVSGGGVSALKITLAPFTLVFGAIGVTTPLIQVTGSGPGTFYDVCRIPGQDRMYVCLGQSGGTGPSTTGYSIASIDNSFSSATLGFAFPITVFNPIGIGYLALPGPIAIAVSPDAAFATVVRLTQSSTNVFSEVWNVTAQAVNLTLVTSNVVVGTYGTGTTVTQITAAYRLTKDSGNYRCYAFWTCDEADNVSFENRSNWIDATATTGTAAGFVYALGIGARAFAHDSHVYLVGTFAGLSFSATDPSGTHSELQNTYYLYRDDAFLIAKAVWGEGGGFQPKGWLPNVLTDSSDANEVAFMAAIRRIVPVGSNTTNPITGVENYAERAPREVKFTFDDDRARRCVQVGASLYVTGGLVLQYDGTQLTEVGFATYPWFLNETQLGTGLIAAAGYSYKATNRWNNAKGEIDRSTTATVSNITVSAPSIVNIALPSLYITRKTNVALEIWRTEGAPAPGAPFFLVTSQDPSTAGTNNGYLVSDPAAVPAKQLDDNLADASIAVLAANPENGAVLSPIEPPAASIIFSDSQRVYLAGIPGSPNTVYYSKYRQDGAVAAFNDALSFEVPADGGAIVALSNVIGTLIVWCETATYAFSGVGFDDTGQGSNFALQQTISRDLGCVVAEAIAFYDDGFLVKTNKGWFLLDRSLNYHYVGGGVFRYDGESVLSMIVLTARHQVRVLTANRMLVFDTLVGQWAESSIDDGVDMMLWNGAPAYLTATGVRAELSTWDGYAGTDYTLTAMDIETSWIKFNDLQGRAIVDFVQLLGEFRSTCVIRQRMAKDYEAVSPGVWNYNTDKTWTPFPATAGSSLQVRQGPRFKRCESLKARFTITAPGGTSPLGGPCARLTSIVIPHAIEPNAYGAIAAAQKQ